MRPLMARFYQWITSWHFSSSRKSSTSSVGPSTSSNGSNFSCESSVSALKGDKLTSSNIKKVVRFAEENGKVLTEVLNNNDVSVDKTVDQIRPLDESLEEVYINDGLIRGFINVKNLESGRQVLVRYTEDNWKGFKQVKPRLVERITDSKGKRQIKVVKEKRKILRRRKQVNPSADTIANHEKTYLFKIEVEQAKLNHIELVVISSLDNVIDTNHRQCYTFKSLRRSWEANRTNETCCSRQMVINGRTFSRQL